MIALVLRFSSSVPSEIVSQCISAGGVFNFIRSFRFVAHDRGVDVCLCEPALDVRLDGEGEFIRSFFSDCTREKDRFSPPET